MIGPQPSTANRSPAPDGKVDDMDTLIETLNTRHEQNDETIDEVGCIIEFGYENERVRSSRSSERVRRSLL